LLLFENSLLSHRYWPRDVQHVEDTMYTPNLQMAVDMSVQQSWYIFIRCYLRSDNCLFKECRVPRLTRSKVQYQLPLCAINMHIYLCKHAGLLTISKA